MTLYQIDIKTNWHRICKQKSHKHPRTFLGWQITGACLQRNCYDPGHHVGKAGIHLYTRIPNNVIVTQCTDLLHHFHHDSKMRPLLSETMGSTKEHSIAWKYSPCPHWQWNFFVRPTLAVAITISSTLLNPGSDRTGNFQNEITTHSYQPLRW